MNTRIVLFITAVLVSVLVAFVLFSMDLLSFPKVFYDRWTDDQARYAVQVINQDFSTKYVENIYHVTVSFNLKNSIPKDNAAKIENDFKDIVNNFDRTKAKQILTADLGYLKSRDTPTQTAFVSEISRMQELLNHL